MVHALFILFFFFYRKTWHFEILQNVSYLYIFLIVNFFIKLLNIFIQSN